MGIMEILGVAASVSLLAGWRLYLCIFATGLAMRLGWIAPPEHLQGLAVLANDWVMGAAGPLHTALLRSVALKMLGFENLAQFQALPLTRSVYALPETLPNRIHRISYWWGYYWFWCWSLLLHWRGKRIIPDPVLNIIRLTVRRRRLPLL